MVKKKIDKTLKEWKRYHRISDVGKISRRYFPLYKQTNIIFDFKTFKFNFVALFPINYFVVF